MTLPVHRWKFTPWMYLLDRESRFFSFPGWVPFAPEKCISGQSQAWRVWWQHLPPRYRKMVVQGGHLSSGAWGAGSGSHLWFWLEKTKSLEANRGLYTRVSNSSYHWSRCHKGGGSGSPADGHSTDASTGCNQTPGWEAWLRSSQSELPALVGLQEEGERLGACGLTHTVTECLGREDSARR